MRLQASAVHGGGVQHKAIAGATQRRAIPSADRAKAGHAAVTRFTSGHAGKNTAAKLLSCLFGSEAGLCEAGLVPSFLSCLFGSSETVAGETQAGVVLLLPCRQPEPQTPSARYIT